MLNKSPCFIDFLIHFFRIKIKQREADNSEKAHVRLFRDHKPG